MSTIPSADLDPIRDAARLSQRVTWDWRGVKRSGIAQRVVAGDDGPAVDPDDSFLVIATGVVSVWIPIPTVVNRVRQGKITFAPDRDK